MSFMKPEHFEGTMVITESHEEICSVPLEYYSEQDHGKKIDEVFGHWIRLSAPGYLDCTEWQGPYASEEHAEQELAETYELCPTCLGDHEMSEECQP